MQARTLFTIFMLASTPCFAADGAAAGPTPATRVKMDPAAAEVLKQAINYLKTAKTLTVQAVIDFEVFLSSGHKMQLEKQVDILLERPDKVRAEIKSDIAHRRLYYDGKAVTIYNEDFNVFTAVEATGTIDDMADTLYEKFDVALPLVDVLVNDPFANYEAKATFSRYLGLHDVNGEPCHHLLLSNAEIDYQIWILDGEEPKLRKIVIDYVREPGVPQYNVRFGDWVLGTQTNDAMFDFTAPKGAAEIGILPVVVVEEESE